jgi:uncharacterized membrane protein YgcG
MESSKKNDGNSGQNNNAKEKLSQSRPYSRRSITLKQSEWKRRRLRLDLGLLSILVLVFYIIFKGNDAVIYQQSVIALIAAGVALLGQYVFGAVWDDKNYMNTIASMHQAQLDATGGSSGEFINTGDNQSDTQTDQSNSGDSSGGGSSGTE